MSNTITMSKIAEALSVNRSFKNARINGESVGVLNAKLWKNILVTMRKESFTVAKYRYDNLANENAEPCNMDAVYNAIREAINLIGDVNGTKLNINNVVELVIGKSISSRVIDITPEMAHAHAMLSSARKSFKDDESDENARVLEHWKNECTRLENEPDNCKRINEIASENMFAREVEIIFGDAILNQSMRSYEDVMAEAEALKKERAERRKAKKAEKKAENK